LKFLYAEAERTRALGFGAVGSGLGGVGWRGSRRRVRARAGWRGRERGSRVWLEARASRGAGPGRLACVRRCRERAGRREIGERRENRGRGSIGDGGGGYWLRARRAARLGFWGLGP
jgi:hypothetical protein